MRTYAGHSTATASNALYRTNLAKGQTGLSVAFDLPTQTGYDPDDSLSRGEVGKVGVPIPHLGEMRRLFDGHPAHRDEHVDDDQRDRDVAARALPGGRGGAEPRSRPVRGRPPAGGYDPERHRQGVPLPRHVRLPARALAAPDHGRDRLHRARDPQLEPDQHLQLPPPGGRSDTPAGAGLRVVHGDLGARRREGVRPGVGGRLRQGRRTHVVLRQRRGPVRRGDVQDAGVRRAVGRDHPRPLRRGRPQDAPVPLRRPGQQPRAHRGPAGEQRPADRARDARRDPVQGRPRPRRPAAGVERGARPASAVGPAVVAAAPAGAGLRVGPARVRRPLRRLSGRRGQGRRARGGGSGRDRPGPGDGRGDRRRRERLHEAGAGLVPRRPARRGSSRGRRSWSGSTGSRPPSRRRSPPTSTTVDPGRRPRGRAGGVRERAGVEGRAGRDGGVRGTGPAGRRRQDRRQPDAGHPGRRPGRCDDGGVGRHPARGVRRVPRADRRERRRRASRAPARTSPRCVAGCARRARS